MSLLLYNVFLRLYTLGILMVSPWNVKARLWIQGRKNIFQKLEKALFEEKRPVIWMHCASLGEFEQGRPLLEKITSSYPGHAIMLTFFSASGYESTKSYKGADYIFYLPMEGKTHAAQFVNIVKPKLVLWVKYEYWYYYLTTIRSKKIPLLLISGIFRTNQGFFQWYKRIYIRMLHCFTHLFVQDELSRELLSGLGCEEDCTVSGDTRFDRVITIAESFQPIPGISEFCGDSKVIVAGSTWQEDEEELDHYANTHPEIKFLIAPHEIDPRHVQEVQKMYDNCILYSAFIKSIKENTAPINHQETQPNVLIIDNIGMLSRLYKYGTINFVGGGFGDGGIHNILEAAVYGKPVVFGPVYDKYIEANELLEEGGAFSVAIALELEDIMNKLQEDHSLYQRASIAAADYVYAKRGATEKIMEYIRSKHLLANQENRLLTS